MDNLRYGDPDASDEHVIHATQVAGIHNFIVSLLEGYQAIVGERGVNLS
jgi:ATP-binding cassette subfamily B protein